MGQKKVRGKVGKEDRKQKRGKKQKQNINTHF
jgi:hypothetical protein